jgi:hypothetical protein
MYNEISYVLKYKTPPMHIFGVVSTKWDSLDDYSKALVPQELKNLSESYSLTVESYCNFLESKDCQEAIAYALKEAAPIFNRIQEETQEEKETFSPTQWLGIFGGIILATDDKDKLYKNLIDYCHERNIDTALVDNIYKTQRLPFEELEVDYEVSIRLIEIFSCGKLRRDYCNYIRQIRDRLEKILNQANQLKLYLSQEISRLW